MSLPTAAPRPPTLAEALVPVICLFVFLAGAVIDLNSLPPIPLLTVM